MAGPYVRAAAARHLRDLATGAERGLRFNAAQAKHVIDFFPDCLMVEFDGETVPFDLLPEQAFIVGSLFGWQRRDGDKWFRRFDRAYIEGGKGSGKTPLAAGIGLYMMLGDDELSAEVYSAGSKRDQAMILFGDAVAMAQRSPEIRSLHLVFSGKNPVWAITQRATNSKFRPLSSDKLKSGQRVHCGLVDELHEHKDRYTVDMLKAGFKGRKQPLLFVITNSGFDRTTICWEWHEHAVAVVDGLRDDDQIFAYVMALDDADDPLEDESCWPKTNPGIGRTITLQYLRSQVNEARQIPGRENSVRRLNFCQWCVTPDTLVSMADGSRKRADALAAGEIILAFDEGTQEIVKARVAIVKDNGRKPVFKIVTSRGRTTRVTAEHRFWSRWGRTDAPIYGWKRAESLGVGDRLATALGYSLPKGGRYLNADEARFLGIMIGDGTCTGTPRLTNIDREVIQWCASYAAAHGCKLAPLPDGYHWDFRHAETETATRKTRGLQTKIKYILKRHGVYGKIHRTKRVPRMVERGGPKAWAAFLSGYLDADGDVGDRRIRWTSCNRPLLADCQHLLALLGIESAINEPRPNGFRLEIRDVRSLGIAADALSPLHSKKAAGVAAFSALRATAGRSCFDRQRFDRIVSIEKQTEKSTVGIEVEGVHTHITDGLITHNTDADVGWVTRNAWVQCEEELTAFRLPKKGTLLGGGAAIGQGFEGAELYLGLDLAFAFDLAALAFAFPEKGEKGQPDKMLAWIEYFTPAETAEKREKVDRVPYVQWIQQGLIHGVPGKIIRKEHIAARIAEVSGRFDVTWAAFDRYRHKELDQEMIEQGVAVPWIEHPQGFRRGGQLDDVKGADGKPLDNPLWMPDSVEKLETRILERTIRVQPSPVTRWQVSSVAIRQDPAGTGNRVFDKRRAVGRIDGIVALAMAEGAAEMRLPRMDLSGFLSNPVRTP